MSLDNPTTVVALSLFLALILIIAVRKQVPKGLRLPPGPPGKFIVGNMKDIPAEREWETYTRWAKEYGDLVYIKVFGQPMVFVNSLDIAHELFENRSALYSDRHHFVMMNELMGFDWTFGLMPYGDRWRQHRKTFHQQFQPSAVSAYHDLQIKHTRTLLRSFHKSPADFVTHIRHLTGATIMEIIYGINVLPTNDPYIDIAERVVASVIAATNPGSFLVDTFPILKYVPAWFPGAGFQKKALVWRDAATEMATRPFLEVKRALATGKAKPSYTAALLEELENDPAAASPGMEDVIRESGAQAYGAGADTTVSALESFVLAMVLYPEVQRKAQAELDAVVGTGRLPTFADREHLPYINALCKEVLRWNPVTPLGIAHSILTDDVFGDYFIPAGSFVIGNAWAILRDEKIYGPNTGEFIPERFLKPDVKEPTEAFGFGRRICPGRHMADNSIFMAAAASLVVFNFSRARDSNGKEIPVEPLYTSGFMSHPVPFKCQIVPRSKAAESLIWENADD